MRSRKVLVRASAEIRATTWAIRAIVAAQQAVKSVPLTVQLPPAPQCGPLGYRAVSRTVGATRRTCLVSALVRQAYLRSNGVEVDVVIGVQRPEGSFGAHAWLQGEGEDGHQELARLRSKPTRGSPGLAG